MRHLPYLMLLAATIAALASIGTPSRLVAEPAEDIYNPGVGDMMNTIIQPHHAKLGLALREENFALAFYLARQLRQGFEAIARVHPKWRNMSINEMIDTVTGKPLRDLDEAIKARDLERFGTAYGELTDACNACHAAVNYSFIVIKAPDQSAFPNQDFRTVK